MMTPFLSAPRITAIVSPLLMSLLLLLAAFLLLIEQTLLLNMYFAYDLQTLLLAG